LSNPCNRENRDEFDVKAEDGFGLQHS
jgi:hypothetical protein